MPKHLFWISSPSYWAFGEGHLVCGNKYSRSKNLCPSRPPPELFSQSPPLQPPIRRITLQRCLDRLAQHAVFALVPPRDMNK